MSLRIFAVTNRGLEHISADEMKRIPGLQEIEVAYRRITAAYQGDLSPLLSLRTVDDVFLELAAWHEVSPQRSFLKVLEEWSKRLRIRPALEEISRLRPLSDAPSFSVTANFVGRRNYTTEEIKHAIAAGLTARHQGKYTAEDLSEVNIRVFIEHDRAYVGLRIGEKALHRRAYKHSHVPSSLKPSVAAALLHLAEILPAQRLLDPFCGAGTILVEAARLGCLSLGGDKDEGALQAANMNAGLASAPVLLHLWDAQYLPVATHSVERIVTNVPWGGQVIVSEDIHRLYKNFCYEFDRILKKNGKIVLLTNLPELVQFNRLAKETEIEISLFGLTPKILKFS